MIYFLSSIWFCVYLTLVLPVILAKKRCPQCPGPLAHYKALDCKPVLQVADDCCAWQYDCDHLYKRILLNNRKCYLYDREYEIGESIIRSNKYLCKELCTCVEEHNLADFQCEKLDCVPSADVDRSQPTTVKQHLPTKETKCNKTMVRSGCKLRGMIYLPGEAIIIPMYEKKYMCTCNKIGSWQCKDYITDLDIHAANGFYKNCAPVYLTPYQGKHITAQRITWRCQTDDDVVIPTIHSEDMKIDLSTHTGHGPLTTVQCPYYWDIRGTESTYSCLLTNLHGPHKATFDMTYAFLCRFGQMTMHVGDRLNNIDYGDGCIVCSCQVPPVPTCVWKQDMSCTEFAQEEGHVSKLIQGQNLEYLKQLKDCMIISSYVISRVACNLDKESQIHAMCSIYKCVADPVFID